MRSCRRKATSYTLHLRISCGSELLRRTGELGGPSAIQSRVDPWWPIAHSHGARSRPRRSLPVGMICVFGWLMLRELNVLVVENVGATGVCARKLIFE
jgi:hypothetical protein